jgi:hypothetical protein
VKRTSGRPQQIAHGARAVVGQPFHRLSEAETIGLHLRPSVSWRPEAAPAGDVLAISLEESSMILRAAVLLVSLSLASLSAAACRGSEGRPSETQKELWSFAGATYGGPDAGLPPYDAGLPPLPDAGVPFDAGLVDGPRPPDGGSPYDGGQGYDGGHGHDGPDAPPDAGVYDGPYAPPDGPRDGGHGSDGGHGHDGPPGTIPYDGGTGKETWWDDTDGVDPELAGCHIEYTAAGCGNEANPGRHFGELCMGNILVETNPGINECHKHAGDVGHPYVVDCDKWCRNTYGIPLPIPFLPKFRGVVAPRGRCQVIGYMPCSTRIVDSARCLCSDGYYGNGVTEPPAGYPGG